jgi:ribosomal-protein-alanine N-acetyltransferase
MKLRAATAKDAAALAEVHAQAFGEPWTPEAFGELLAGPGAYAVAAEDDRMVGLILMRALAGEGEVITLAVAPSHRRQGVARALLEAGLGLAGQAGAEAMFLEVAADNGPAIDLYRAAGFETVGRRAGYYKRTTEPVADALVLRRVINGGGLP